MTKKQSLLSRLLSNNWVITLFSTMAGVIIGLYLTNYSETKKLKDSQLDAFDKVKQELRVNEQAVKNYDSISIAIYENASYVFQYLTDDRQLIIPRDSLNVFRQKSQDIISDLTFESIQDNRHMLRIRGEMNLYVNSKLSLLDLNSVIWDSYKQTDFLNITDFECVTTLEETYQFQKKYNEVNRQWSKLFIDGDFLSSNERLKDFMKLWQKLVDMNKVLLKMYSITDENLSNCS